MKYFIFVLFFSCFAQSKEFLFKYQYQKQVFSIKVSAESKQKAFAKSAKLCYLMLSNNKFPGEEAGMDMIDACANPR